MHRRRWFQFGLRTMFVVVALVAVFLGWELRLIRQRQAIVQMVRERGGLATTTPSPLPWRRLLGDEEMEVYGFLDLSESEVHRIRYYFPELIYLTGQ